MGIVFKLDKTDKRITLLEKLLIADGYKVLADAETTQRTDKTVYVFAPNFVLSASGLTQFEKGSIIYCGKKNATENDNAFKDYKVYEMLKDEEFACKNAIYTAESVILLLLSKTENQLNQLNILVIGYGRCGKALTKYLYDMRANLTVLTSKPYEAMFYCNSKNYGTCSFAEYDVIINTAPSKIIDDSELINLKKNVIVMDIASAPYGLNHKLAKDLNLNADVYPALPAKYRVESATQAIYEYIKKTQGELYE